MTDQPKTQTPMERLRAAVQAKKEIVQAILRERYGLGQEQEPEDEATRFRRVMGDDTAWKKLDEDQGGGSLPGWCK